jgi:hypothetical protein
MEKKFKLILSEKQFNALWDIVFLYNNEDVSPDGKTNKRIKSSQSTILKKIVILAMKEGEKK